MITIQKFTDVEARLASSVKKQIVKKYAGDDSATAKMEDCNDKNYGLCKAVVVFTTRDGFLHSDYYVVVGTDIEKLANKGVRSVSEHNIEISELKGTESFTPFVVHLKD